MKTKTMQSIQRSNYSNIYHLLMSNDKLSKQMVADELGLSLPTVTGNLNQLIDQELIMKNGQLESKIGRRATAYSVNPNAFLSIGIEVFQKYATITVINLKHEVLAIHTVNIPFANNEQYATALADQVRWLLQNNGYNEKSILGAGIGIQGLIDGAGTTVLWGKILGCTGMRADLFSQFLPFQFVFTMMLIVLLLLNTLSNQMTKSCCQLVNTLGAPLSLMAKFCAALRGGTGQWSIFPLTRTMVVRATVVDGDVLKPIVHFRHYYSQQKRLIAFLRTSNSITRQ